ncbi:Laminin G domain containing protein 2, partial [Sarcoptes scabiei]
IGWNLDGTSSSFLQFQSWRAFFSDNNRNGIWKSSLNFNIDDLDRRNDQYHSKERKHEQNEADRNLHETSISFEFLYRLDSSSLSRPLGGLLLYTDDETGIGGRFIEIKLLSDTNLRIRIDDNSYVRPKNIIELGQKINFTDSRWHRIELKINPYHQDNRDRYHNQNDQNYRHNFRRSTRQYWDSIRSDYDRITNRSTSISTSTTTSLDHQSIDDQKYFETIIIKIDSEIISKQFELSRSKPSYLLNNHRKFRNHHQNRALFIGGLPEEYRQQFLSHLASPTVAYELHFRGLIRNKNLIETKLNGRLNEYIGNNHLDLPNAWCLISSQESFEISFRTKQSNGLLLLSSDEFEDYLAITIRDACLTLTIKFGPTIVERTIAPSRIRFDDNQWHSVVVRRRIVELSSGTYFCHFSITVDDIYTRIGSVASPLRYLVSKAFYVGGIAHQGRTLALENEVSFDRWNRSTEQFNQQASSMSRNFYGCLRKGPHILFCECEQQANVCSYSRYYFIMILEKPFTDGKEED